MAINGSALISLLLLFVLAVGLWDARDWSLQAGLFPRALVVAALVLAFWQLILDLIQGKKGGTDPGAAGIVDLPVDRDVPLSEAMRRAGVAFAWIFGLTLAIWVVGFGAAVPLFLFLYILLQAGERWWFALAAALLMSLFQYVVFERIIHTNWPAGALQQWMNL